MLRSATDEGAGPPREARGGSAGDCTMGGRPRSFSPREEWLRILQDYELVVPAGVHLVPSAPGYFKGKLLGRFGQECLRRHLATATLERRLPAAARHSSRNQHRQTASS